MTFDGTLKRALTIIYHYVIKQSAKKYGADQNFYTVEPVPTKKHQLLFYYVYDIIFSFLTSEGRESRSRLGHETKGTEILSLVSVSD